MVNLSVSKDPFNLLARRLKRGNRQAGAKIFDHFSPQIFRFFLVRTFNRDIAQDLTQEVFLKVIAKIKTFDERLGSFSGWIWQITKNTAKDYWRKKKAIPLSDEMLKYKENKDFLDGKNSPELKIKIDEILDLIKDLNEQEQEVFSLHYLSDLPYRTISRMLKKSESSLRVLVHRVNKKIRKIIKDA